jgi:D-arginine dehydrogenase
MKTDVLIIGSGFAGAATAFHLSNSFSGSILVIDKEQVPGFHASGRNASLVRHSVEIPEIRRAVAASSEVYRQQQAETGFTQSGSLLLGTRDQLAAVRETALIDSFYEDPREVRQQIQLLRNHHFEAVLRTPSDGVMDIAKLLQFYLGQAQRRGVHFLLDCVLTGVDGTRSFRLQTSQGQIEAEYLINAAGAWAPVVARMAGAANLSLNPLKRHLFVLDAPSDVGAGWPFVWSLDHNFYFRPESGGLLLSICDEEVSSGFEPTVSPDISQSMVNLVWDQLPALRDAAQRQVWSCFRTLSPDGSFVVGWDYKVDRFFWVAALSGHGMGASWGIGQLAAQQFMEQGSSQPHPCDPIRFAERDSS